MKLQSDYDMIQEFRDNYEQLLAQALQLAKDRDYYQTLASQLQGQIKIKDTYIQRLEQELRSWRI